jgi:hypothetical protein
MKVIFCTPKEVNVKVKHGRVAPYQQHQIKQVA